MAESSLTTTYSDIQKEVGRELGWGRTPGTDTDTTRVDWTKENFTDFGLIAKEGYRQFLYPEPLPGENKSHNWSFLYPLAQLFIGGTWPSETVESDLSGNVTMAKTEVGMTDPDWGEDQYLHHLTIGSSAGEWPKTLIGATVAFTDVLGASQTGTVTSRTTTILTFATGTNINDAAGIVTALNISDFRHVLPDDFGGMASEGFTYTRSEQWHLPDIRIIGEGDIRKIDRVTTGDIYPKVASLVPLAPVAATGGSGGTSGRWMARFYPQSDTEYEVEYRYHAIPPALDASTNIYHYGGAEHSSTIIASIVDVAYQKIRASTEKHEYFLTRLRQSVLHDRRNYQPQYIGPGSKSRGDYSERDALREFRSSISTSNISTTFS